MLAKKIHNLALVILLAGNTFPVWAEAPSPEALKDKASYSIGINLGKQLAMTKEDINLDQFISGVQDAFSGKESKLSNEEMQSAMTSFRESMQKKQLAKQEEQANKNKSEGEAFLAANKKKDGITTLESGLQYQVIKSGNGDSPKATDTVVTHYHGTLINGEVFDSSIDRGEPATFPVSGVIKGWTEALQKMKVGDKWKIFVPSDLAYGASGAGPKIGPNSTLVFDIELLEIKK